MMQAKHRVPRPWGPSLPSQPCARGDRRPRRQNLAAFRRHASLVAIGIIQATPPPRALLPVLHR